MKTENVKIVLCRSLPEKNDIQKALESAGYTCECLQTLQFKFVNISELRACLSRADKYSGNISNVRKISLTFIMGLYLANSHYRSDTN